MSRTFATLILVLASACAVGQDAVRLAGGPTAAGALRELASALQWGLSDAKWRIGSAGWQDRGALVLDTIGVALDTAAGVMRDAREATSTETSSELVGVFRCRFGDEKWDVNYDAWPDRWERYYDADRPKYVSVQIEPIEGSADQALVIRPDGASATAISPPIHVLPKFSYKLRFLVRGTGVQNGVVRVRMVFRSRNGKDMQVEQTSPIKCDGSWRQVELGDYQPEFDNVDRVHMEFDYTRGDRGDLNAKVEFTDVRLYRLPSIRIRTDRPYNVYHSAEDVRISCSLSGILERNPEIRFQLLDATNKRIGDRGMLNLAGKVINESNMRASDIVDGYGSDQSSYEGTVDWHPPIPDYGFYRVQVGMFSEEDGSPVGDARSITLAVVPKDLETSEHGEFGWSLPRADDPLSFTVLKQLLPSVGVKHVKLPVWYPAGDERRADTLVRFAEQLATSGIHTIGVLEDPTLRLEDPASDQPPPPIQSLLSADPSYWTPLVDHVITRLSLRIRWWQYGADNDTSFVGYDDLPAKIGAIRNQMFRFGQDIRLGIGYRWDHAREWRERLTWDFEQMTGREQLDAAGLASAMAKAPPPTAERLVLVAPPEVELSVPEGADPDDPHDPLLRLAMVKRHQQRVRDFVEQILVAKMNDADGIFIADPFSGSADVLDGRSGVMNDDGTPGELLLPWRTCARLLGGADYLGSIHLPGESNNWLFKRPDGKVVMVLWNLDAEVTENDSSPLQEVLYLGEGVQVIDVWGKVAIPDVVDGRHVIPVGRTPRFVVGLNEAIARWRMAAHFERYALPSVFGERHSNTIHLVNTFPQGVGGQMRVFIPSVRDDASALSNQPSREWEVLPNVIRLSLPAGATAPTPAEFILRNASYGHQPVRLDFEISADREYKFSVWRALHVGLDDIQLEVNTFIDDANRLIVEQRMRKVSGPASDFRCELFAKPRRRQRAQVYQLGPDTDKRVYRYLNAAELVGKELRLQIEEADGRRRLIYRFVVEPKPLPKRDPQPDAQSPADDLASAR